MRADPSLSPAHPGNTESRQVAPIHQSYFRGPRKEGHEPHFHLLPPRSPHNRPYFANHARCPPSLPPPNWGHKWEERFTTRKWQGGPCREGTLTLRFPSAVIRSRLQVPQKCSDMDVIKLSWPRKPGILKVWGGGAEKKGSRGDGAAWATEGTGAPTPQPSQEEPRRREDPRPPATRRRTRRMTYKLSACTWPARQQTCYGLGGLRALWPEHLSTAH